MGTAFLYGNGGGSDNLNLRVIGSTTEPSNPKENDIWIKTSFTIPKDRVFFNEWVSVFWPEAGDGAIYIPYEASNSQKQTSTGLNVVRHKGNLAEFNANLLGCQQLISGEWKNMYACIYHLGTWVQFSREFSATIHITYPAGSTCTATYGATTLTAPDTTGSWACIVPNAGTWTITATNRTDTATASVTITEDGQSKSVTLTYRLPYFYYNGSKNVTLSGSSYSDSGGYITIISTSDGSGDRNPTVSFAIPEIQKYKTIKCTINFYDGSNPTIRITDSSGSDVASVTANSVQTYAIDISSKSLSGNGYRFVLGTSSWYDQTDEFGNGEWVAGTVKTNHIWGE